GTGGFAPRHPAVRPDPPPPPSRRAAGGFHRPPRARRRGGRRHGAGPPPERPAGAARGRAGRRAPRGPAPRPERTRQLHAARGRGAALRPPHTDVPAPSELSRRLRPPPRRPPPPRPHRGHAP